MAVVMAVVMGVCDGCGMAVVMGVLWVWLWSVVSNGRRGTLYIKVRLADSQLSKICTSGTVATNGRPTAIRISPINLTGKREGRDRWERRWVA